MTRKRVLMIAYHFPPVAGSSGIQRTLRFVQQLPEFGWDPVVLTIAPFAYERRSDELLAEVPESVVVERAWGLDTARHLAPFGRYPGALARPDRWMSWKFDGARRGVRLVQKYRPDVIWSTYPIATAHLIGEAVHTRTGVPWVADFRDPMAQSDYPADLRTRRHFELIEAATLAKAARSVFVTPGAAEHYRRKYPEAAQRIQLIENGYDEESFSSLPAQSPHAMNGAPAPVTLLHSGIVYPSERDPTQLFAALQRLVREGRLAPGQMTVKFRAAVHNELLDDLATRYGVADFIQVLPPIGYREALAEMQSVDGLLVLQASNCNQQIPAKLYEYLRCGKPIIGLTDPAGDTAALLQRAQGPLVAPLDHADSIAALLHRFMSDAQLRDSAVPDAAFVATVSRRARARELAELFEGVAREASPAGAKSR
jgi:glycosyltransferase involved in cell wall biosynthesis